MPFQPATNDVTLNTLAMPDARSVRVVVVAVRYVVEYLLSMRRLFRPFGILLTIVLLQLVLVESGYACQMESKGVANGAAMAGMPMPNDGGRSHSPCQFPWAPSGCQLLAPCGAPMAVAEATSTEPQLTAGHIAPPVLEALEPLSLSVAPELPPPRA